MNEFNYGCSELDVEFDDALGLKAVGQRDCFKHEPGLMSCWARELFFLDISQV